MKTELGAGAALERAIRDDVGELAELDPREEMLLMAAARQADDIAALEADIADRGHILDTGTLNASVREVRQARTALGRLLAGIDLPAGASSTTLRAERGGSGPVEEGLVTRVRGVARGAELDRPPAARALGRPAERLHR